MVLNAFPSLCFLRFRRAHLRDCLELLKELVPSPPEHQKATTLALLQSAQQYIQVNITLLFFLFFITTGTLALQIQEIATLDIFGYLKGPEIATMVSKSDP